MDKTYDFFPSATQFRVSSFFKEALHELSYLLGATVFLALCAQIAIPLPFTPIPLSMQTLAVLLIGAFMGKTRALAVISFYLWEGAIGLPVFANGLSGLPTLLGPKGGYLVGFAAAAYFIGWLMESPGNRKGLRLMLSLLAANSLIYISGLAWLSVYIDKGLLLGLGLYPFILGDLLKIGIVSFLIRKG